MKMLLMLVLTVSAMTLLSGCAWEIGGAPNHTTVQPTVGQQLIDLQKARDSGAISDGEQPNKSTAGSHRAARMAGTISQPRGFV